MTFDSHVHVFPYLGDASGYPTVEAHLQDSQRLMQLIQAEPTVRRRDDQPLAARKLWDQNDTSASGALPADFRVGRFGRFEWTQDGEDCYLQFLPPSMQEMVSPPQLLLAMMARAGVTRAVIQCGSIYGRLNRFHAEMLRQEPDLRGVLFPLAQVYESRATDSDQVQELHRAIVQDGLRGLWFTCSDPTTLSRTFDPFWNEVAALGIPVFFDFYPSWADGVRRMGPWHDRFPDITVVLPQSFPIGLSEPADLIIEDDVQSIIEAGRVLVELAYPIARGGVEEYPFRSSLRAVRTIYEALGPDKLVWGSDAPNVERYCTYGQSLKYLTDYCDFISPEDLQKITEGNLSGIF